MRMRSWPGTTSAPSHSAVRTRAALRTSWLACVAVHSRRAADAPAGSSPSFDEPLGAEAHKRLCTAFENKHNFRPPSSWVCADQVVGNRTKVTVVKNKIAPPFRKVEFDILYNHGISKEGDLIDLGLIHNLVLKSGTWFSYKHPTEAEVRLGQGRARARTFLMDNPDLAEELAKGILERAMPKPTLVNDAPAEAGAKDTVPAPPAAAPPAKGGAKAAAAK